MVDIIKLVEDVVFIVGGGFGISVSCVCFFVCEGMKVVFVVRNWDKEVFFKFESEIGVWWYVCDVVDIEFVDVLFVIVGVDLVLFWLVVYNIDGCMCDIFCKEIVEVDLVFVY